MSKEEESSFVIGCKVELDDESPPLMLKKKMNTLLSTMHWMTKARVWRKIKTKGLQLKPKQTKRENVGATFGAS